MEITQSQLVYIAGPGHSGSTLLDMLLGGHPSISALGEIHRFFLSLHKESRPHRCDCGQPVLECSFWKNVIDRLVQLTGLSREDIQEEFYTTDPAHLEIPDNNTILAEPPVPARYRFDIARVLAGVGPTWSYWLASYMHQRIGLYRQIARNSHLLYDAVRDVAQTPIIVDSSKNPIRLRTLYYERPFEVKVIYVIRDGRAVTHSRMQRHGVSMSDAAKVWVAEHRKQAMVQRHIPTENILNLRYEDMCRGPDTELRRVCAFLGVGYDPNILAFRSAVRHAVGGNPMRFNKGANQIGLRERWRVELSAEDLDEFKRVGGKINREFGYD